MLRVGIAGCGYWGSKHLRVFNELPDCQVRMICDPDAARLTPAAAPYPLATATTSFDEMVTSELDAVVIATPAQTHYQLAKKALQHDKSVLVEKPFTTSSSHALELIRLADERGRALGVGHTFLYNSAIARIKELIDSGHLGEILYIHSSRLNFGLLQPDVDVLWDLAPHDISILLHLLGDDPTAAGARGVSCFNTRQSEVVHADLLFPNQVSAHIHVSWLNPSKVRRVTIVGSERMLVYDDVSMDEPVRIYDRVIKFQSTNGASPKHSPVYRSGDVRIPNVTGEEPLKQECADFIASARTGRSPLSDGWIGLRVVKVLELLQLSLSQDGALQSAVIAATEQQEYSRAAGSLRIA